MLLGLWLARNINEVRGVMVTGASCLVALSIWLTVDFISQRAAGNTAEMLYTYSHVWFAPLNIAYAVGVDGISVVMLLLSSIIVFTGTFASWKLQPLTKEFFMWFTLLSTGVFGFFISIDLFTMFMFYEVALIPMYLLIGYWGSGKKEYAAMKLTLMLMGGSAHIIVGLVGIYFFSGGQTMNLLDIAHHTNGAYMIPAEIQKALFPFVFIGFGVLGALFPFHTWSPIGHGCAPTSVSMLHAGVLMKLGGYGCFRIAMYLLPEATNDLAWIFLILTTISVVYGAFSACVQTDLKFITLIGMIYGRTHTRDIRELGGLMKIMPFLSVGYVIAGLANLGLPGFSGFIAEMTIFVGSFENPDTFHRCCTVIACTSIVVTAVYILRTVGFILFGKVTNPHYETLTDATWDEKFAVCCLIFCVAGLGSFPLWASNVIETGVIPILTNIGTL